MQNTTNELGQSLGFPLPSWKPPAAPSRESMAGRFCRLEPLNPSLHAEALYHANRLDTDGRMWTYLPYGPFESLDSYRAWTETMARGDDPLFFTIIDLATKKPVGVASYMRIDPVVGLIEVGHLGYSPLLQRTPAATEAMYLMMEHIFALGYRRYEWKCHSLNAPSRVAAERLGFTFEGVFRQATIVKGRNRDTAWYSIIDSEWPTRRAAFQRWLRPENFDKDGKQRERLAEFSK
ncbi:MAG: GNAT family protein [Planctomycetota bacterium]